MDQNTFNTQPEDEDIDPIQDIIDYLVRCAKISFKNSHVDETEVKTCTKIKIAHELFKKSPTDFLMQFGKHLNPCHMEYFENLLTVSGEEDRYHQCVKELKRYHSDTSTRKRIRNRRFNAMQKLQSESDYFSDKQMMYRNPLLYEQLIGQFLTDEEVRERDGVDRENLTFLNMILETVDNNEMREAKNVQLLEEEQFEDPSTLDNQCDEDKEFKSKKRWGDFEQVDTKPSFTPERRKQTMISAPERNLLRQEFLQEMYSSFIDGVDSDVDYHSIDNDEQYDDLQQVSQDAEDRYFDSESNEVENLEQHMELVKEYGQKNLPNRTEEEDPLDEFMSHITLKNNITC